MEDKIKPTEKWRPHWNLHKQKRTLLKCCANDTEERINKSNSMEMDRVENHEKENATEDKGDMKSV